MAIQIDPSFAIAYTSRGNAYSELGQPQRAIEDYTTAVQLDPDDAMAYSNRAVAYKALGQSQQAV